jgi:hypothetical protein
MTNRIIRHARRKLGFEYQYGILSEVGGNVRTPDNAGYYVRPQLSTGQYAPPVRLALAENAVLKPYAGMSVKLTVDSTGQLVIAGPNLAAIVSQGINPISLNPGDRASWGLIRAEEIGTLYCLPHPFTSWAVRVYPGYAQFGDTLVAFAGDDLLRLDNYKPASGNHRYVGVFLTSSGALEVGASTSQLTSTSLDLSDLQECIDASTANSLFLRAYKVAESDTSLIQTTSIDPRSLWSVGTSDFIKLTDTPSAYDDQASHIAGVAGTEDRIVFLDTRRYLVAYNYNFTSNYRIGTAFGVDERNMLIVSEPAVGLGAGGAWDDEHVKDPKLARGALGVIHMYFSGSTDNASGLYKIGLARSYDNGLTWTKYASNPVLSPEASGWEITEGASLSFPAILYDAEEADANKRWKMWYSGGLFGAGGIGYAYSADGISWTKYASNPVLAPTGAGWEQHLIYPGSIVRRGETYYLFYNGYPTGDATGLAGLATFTDPEGTYTRSADNPLVASDGITTTLTASVGIGDTTVAVTSAAIFPIGASVWVYDGDANHYLSRVKKQVSSTSLELTDAAPVAISSTGGNVRSAAYNSINISSAIYDGNGWLFGAVVYQPGTSGTGLKEISAVGYSKDLSSVSIDYGAGTSIPITASESIADNVARENPSILPIREVEHRQDDTGYVPLSIFDANSILKADDDNTPEALTVAEQRIVGRITGGEITDLTSAQVKTLLAIDHGADLVSASLADDDHTQYIINAPGASTRNVIQPTSAAYTVLTIKGAASQSANLTEWHNSSGTALSKMNALGKLIINPAGIASATTALGLLTLGVDAGNPENMALGLYNYFGGLYSSGASIWGYNSKAYVGTTNKVVVANTNATAGYSFIQMGSSGIQIHSATGSVTAGDTATAEKMRITPANGVIINENGDASTDLRAEGDTEANLLFLDASADTIYVGGTTTRLANDKNGDTWWEADGSGLPFGSAYGNDIAWAQATAVQNTWYEVADADMTDGQLNLVTHDGNGKLTVSKAGRYFISYDIVATCSAAGKELQSGISVSGTENDAGLDHEIATNANAKEKLGSHAILDLAANATIEVSIRTTDAGTPDIAVEHLNIVLFMVGGS